MVFQDSTKGRHGGPGVSKMACLFCLCAKFNQVGLFVPLTEITQKKLDFFTNLTEIVVPSLN